MIFKHLQKRLGLTIPIATAVAFALLAGPAAPLVRAAEAIRIPDFTHNLLGEARISGNLDSFGKGQRGRAEHVIFDFAKGTFKTDSEWHEYGVGFGEDLGVVPEDKPAYWLAEWPQPVEANLIALTGAYPNQPQPDAAWKIELRRDGAWSTHARGVGDWYDRGQYLWGGAGVAPLRFDALRVSVFSKDDKTPIKSVHFRGEAGKSWLVAKIPPFSASIKLSQRQIRAGQETEFAVENSVGDIRSWKWNFGDGTEAEGAKVRHTFKKSGNQIVALTISDGKEQVVVRQTLPILSSVQVDMEPLKAPVMAAQPTPFVAKIIAGAATQFTWDFGDGTTAKGPRVNHTFATPGIYQVRLTASSGEQQDDCLALVRAHTEATRHLPQVLLDTDAKNEQDDQHYLGYALFSELDVLATNSIHHGGGQEPVNYAEIQHVYQLAVESGLPQHRLPIIFRGANERLKVPASGKSSDTEPIVTAASEAILAAARGASPDNPIWIVPVGPGTNMASALLQAEREGVVLKDRIRIIWLGGSNDSIVREFNGDNDPWSMYVVAQSGIETWIMPAPVGARVAINKAIEGDLYAENALGRYLKQIVPNGNKALFDPACISVVISERLGLGWVKQTEMVTVAGPEQNYRWTKTDAPSSVRVIREIDQKAMQLDLFNTMKGRPTRMLGVERPIKR
jgi:chitodextrinase